MTASQVSVPVSIGELVDKITILEIKNERLTRPEALDNVRRELGLLNESLAALGLDQGTLAPLRAALKAINEKLWDIEDRIRVKEASQTFDAGFIELARSVYRCNDERAALKRQVNEATGSLLVEEKSYEDY